MTGGISWLSSQFGLACDPQHMLDAQVLKLDGRVMWASEEFKFQAHPYPLKVFGGMIIYPKSSLSAVAKVMEAFSSVSEDCKMAMSLHYLKI